MPEARNVVTGVRGLAVLLPLAAIALFALAVGLARGWRAIALGRVGLRLLAVGGVILLGRWAIQPIVANSLISVPADRAAGRAIWMISTTELRDTAVLTLILGIIVIAVSVVMRVGGSVLARHG